MKKPAALAAPLNLAPRLHRLAVGALLLWTLLAGLYLAHRDSLTTDEGIHVASGYLILTRHDYRFDPEHPPLFKLLSAAPLVAMRPNLPPDDQALWNAGKPTFYDSWAEAREWTEQWFYMSGNNADRMVFAMRVPAVLFMVLACWLAHWLATRWFGKPAGLLTLFFLAFNPTVLGHGHLANDDMPIAAGILASVGMLWWYREKPELKRALLTGLVVAATIGIKYTGLAMGLVEALVFALVALERRSWTPVWHFLASVLAIWAGVWLMYGFQSPLLIDGHIDGLIAKAAPYRHFDRGHVIAIAQVVRYLLPTAFMKGFVLVEIGTRYGRGAYLLGHHYFPDVWYYFPAVFAFKTQLAGLLVLLGGLALALPKLGHRLRMSSAQQILGISFLVLLGTAMANKLQLGVRHVLPVIALLAFYFALSYLALAQRLRYAWVLLPLYALPVLVEFPHMISFTNEAVPYRQAYHYMNDSNLDWGQEAKAVAAYAGSQPLAAQYFWSPYALHYYGVHTAPLDLKNPPHGTLIMLSAMNLSGGDAAAFRSMKPVHVIGNDTFFYRIP